jgi:hypothetical protein
MVLPCLGVWFSLRVKKQRGTDSASAPEASPNAVLIDTSLSPRLNASIDFFLLMRYFGEISGARIKKSTQSYVVLCLLFYPFISGYFLYFLLKISAPGQELLPCFHNSFVL